MQKKKLWNKFDSLTEKCFSNMIGAYKDNNCWMEAFHVLQDIVTEHRTEDPSYAREIYMLDDMTDFEHDVQGWLEVYLDELDMKQMNQELFTSVEWLLQSFSWDQETAGDLNFHKILSLIQIGRAAEAEEFALQWMKLSGNHMQAIAACVYAKLGNNQIFEAKELVETYINNHSKCTEDNCVLFLAAEKVYERLKDKASLKRVKKAWETYEAEMDAEWEAEMDELSDMDDWEDLPFN